MKLILASTSPYRRELLTQLGYSFSCEKPLVEEEDAKQQSWSPEQVSTHLAALKAKDVYERFPHALVVGADQVAACDGVIYSKPGNKERATLQLLSLQGRTHQLHTAIHILGPGFSEGRLTTVDLTMRSLNRSQIDSYLEQDLPYDCAGSYKLESLGIKLFTELKTPDHSAIIGLPLLALQELLLKAGLPLFEP